MTESPRQRATVRERFDAFVQPTLNGLPNRRVVLVPLGVLLGLLIVLVGLGITGSSTGYLNQFVSTAPDDRAIVGSPQSIRSDEWFVQSTWAVSQEEQGLPVRNESFPGGMDATVQHDLPALDWSLVLRPHLWGFLFLPLDNAMALKWWLPGFSLIAAVYLFSVTMLPRRPVTSTFLALGFFFAPFFQWWYLTITLFPPAWALLLMSTVVWLVRGASRTGQITMVALTAYGAAAVGTTIYAPFIIAATWPALAFVLGFVFTRDSMPGASLRDRLWRLRWLAVAAVAAVAVLGVWLATRWETIESFTSTVYPGERLQPVGDSSLTDFHSLMAGVFSRGLEGQNGVPLGGNASEASTFLLPGLFLVVPFIWLIVRRLRAKNGVDWLAVALLGVGVLFAAYMFVPGWDALSHLLLLDRTTPGRLRMGFGILSLVMMVVVAARIDELKKFDRGRIVPIWVPIGATALAFGSTTLVAAWLYSVGSPLVTTWTWVPVFLLVLACVAAFSIGRPLAGATAFLVASVFCGATVNPIYRGVYDLNETDLVAAMERVDRGGEATWVGIGETPIPTVALVESGLHSYNGFQSSPSDEMWEQIDPDGDVEYVWNRLANVSWSAGTGAPSPTNPAPDQIHMTFDSCDAFAQENVDLVLSESPLQQDCVQLVETVREGPSTYRIYEVLPN
ncbi:hypothetical protein [Agromyces laixinhei]|uniref:DUF7657 domain-containing protein n=1 Tax=Agromyces laixinhei TaxID=2585717 RepID=UPI0012ECCC32|nr:hypothetical protein [Agromyces laixinhei]